MTMTRRSRIYFRRRKERRLRAQLERLLGRWDELAQGLYILGEDGEPRRAATVLEWAEAFEHTDRVLHKTRIGTVLVSTVFLGMDSGSGGFPGAAPPLLYETMIFGGPHDQYQCRYATRLEAERGHLEACKIALTPKEEEEESL